MVSTDEDFATLLDQARQKNHALAVALQRATEELGKLKTQLTHLAQPPSTFATFIKIDSYFATDDGARLASVQVFYHGRRMVVTAAPSVDIRRMAPGQTVLLNESMQIVGSRDSLGNGSMRVVDEVLDSQRLVVLNSSSEPAIVHRAQNLENTELEPGQRVRLDSSGFFAVEAIANKESSELVLEEVPDVSFADIGGLEEQIQAVRDAVELPYLHHELFARFGLSAPKGVLLYGPPGNGKTLIAKAVARALTQPVNNDSHGIFLSVKGPELLNKYVGESERLIRSIFKRARAKAAEGVPVVVFIDEMDSLLRIRGTGISSDVENTIVPQFLAELDGIETLTNVIVIGASNRVDMIDPAVLRPGRLDVKIRVGRPGRQQAAAILRHYLSDDLPLADATAEQLIAEGVESIFELTPSRLICTVQTLNGQWKPLYFADLISGAALKNISDRAKTKAVKAALATVPTAAAQPGITVEHMLASVQEEFIDTAGSVSGLSAEQWSSVQGLELGQILAVRPAAQPIGSVSGTTGEGTQ